MEGLQFLKDTIFQRHLLCALSCREEIKDIDPVELCTDTVDSPDALHNTSRVPRQIVIDKNICPVKIDTFGQDICCDQQIVPVVTLILVFGIKAIFDSCFQHVTALTAEANNTISIQIL